MFGIIFAIGVFVISLIAIRELAKRKVLWVIVPANCYALVTTLGETSGDLTQGGGGVTNIIHNVPGRKLIKNHHDLMEWHFVEGEEPRGLLFRVLGVQWIGPFRTLRTNKIRRFRYGKMTEADKQISKEGPFRDYFVKDDDLITEYAPFSGEMAIKVTDAETKDVLELNFLFNAIEESVKPLKAIRVADANAILAGMIKEKVNAITGRRQPEYFLKATPKTTQQVIDAATAATVSSEEEIGKRIVRINLISTDMDEKDRALFELAARTERENAAEIAVAEKNRIVQVKQNDADADRIQRVVKPAAENELTVSARWAEAYERNQTVTTLVTGQGAAPVIPVGGSMRAPQAPPAPQQTQPQQGQQQQGRPPRHNRPNRPRPPQQQP